MPSKPFQPDDAFNQQILEKADLCVKCGLCLPHCPTYQLTGNENESPRGRIALLQAIHRQQIGPSPESLAHLNHCLSCRHCERVCPANVPYEALLIQGRQSLASVTPPVSFKVSALKSLLRSPKKIQWLGVLGYWLEKSGLRRLARRFKCDTLLGLGQLNKLMPEFKAPLHLKSYYPAIGHTRGSVGLFLGCIAKLTDQTTLKSAIYVLVRLGFNVYIPKDQGCCGAMPCHDGQLSQAQKMARTLCQHFHPLPIDSWITCASGCGAQIQDYAHIWPNDPKIPNSLTSKVSDISHFIDTHFNLKNLKPLKKTVALHTPCSLINGMKCSKAPENILLKIPEIKIKKLPTMGQCCGSAGSYMLTQPEYSQKLGEKILSELDDIPASFIATSNIGCALHLRRKFLEQKRAIKIEHPVTFLANALGFENNRY